MDNEIINVMRDNLQNAYNNANNEQKAFLENLFGKETFKQKDIRERIKTFEDACRELGESHQLVLFYRFNFSSECGWTYNRYTPSFESYLKLQIIVAALNEGWEPKFIPGEYRWSPYFLLYTKDEIDEMDEDTKASVVYRSNFNANAYGGVSYANSSYGYGFSDACTGSRLAFKSEELAEYAGKQFIDLYVDFMLGWELAK